MRPMTAFDPAQPSVVHDSLNDMMFEWKPKWADNYREYAINNGRGVIGWDGLLLDGWE